MKKRGMFLFVLLSAIFFSSMVSAACMLDVSLVNQDPYPAVQGESVKLLFQMSGVQNPECNGAYFRLEPGYAFSLPQNDGIRTLSGGTFAQNYKNEWVIPFTLNVNKDAIDGDAQIDVYYSPGTGPIGYYISKKFNVTLRDLKADFEIRVQNYVSLTNAITFQVLNIARVDVRALTINIPNQETISVKGSRTNIVGDLDSQDYTTTSFEAIPKEGDIILDITYTDEVGIRREIQKSVVYDPKDFQDRIADQKSSPIMTWVIVLLVIGLIVYWIYARKKKKKMIEERRKRMR
ncbi:MAG: hypothetical protein KKB62_00390 [Nanoarchaeota archaeon]|nr:hypothetical protein [Nanoarchaeota archaeon]